MSGQTPGEEATRGLVATGAFVKFDKGLYDAILITPMTVVQKDLVLAIVRRTIGHYDQSHARISLTLLERMTGHSRGHIHSAFQVLVREGVLEVVELGDRCTANLVALNVDPTTWGAFQVVPNGNYPGGTQRELPWCRVGTTPSAQRESVGGTQRAPIKDRETIEDFSKDPSGAETKSAPRDEGSVSAQDLVAHAVTYARDKEVTPPHRGHLGTQIKQLLDDGANPDLLLQAIEALVDKGDTPAGLRYILGRLASIFHQALTRAPLNA